MGIWQWILRISGAPDLVVPLLRALAQGHPLEGIGEPAQRAEVLDLFCERDLLAQHDDGSYHYQVPLIARWIAQKRRLPTTWTAAEPPASAS